MNQLVFGICIGALVSGGAVFFIKNTQQGSFQTVHEYQPSSHAISGKSERNQDGSSSSNIVSRVRNFSSVTDAAGRLNLQNDIFNMSISELEQFLDSPEIGTIHFYDQSGMAVLSSAFAKLTSLSPNKALEKLQELSYQAQYVAANAIFMEWAQSSPEEALAKAQEMKDPTTKQAGVAAALAKIAEFDPDRALAIAKKENNQTGKYQVLMAISKDDPQRALEEASTLGQQGTWAQQSIVATWALEDPEAALGYAESIDSATQRNKVISGIIQGLSRSDEERAYTLLGKYQKELGYDQLSQITRSLASINPERALVYAEGLENKSQRANAIVGIIGTALRGDLDKAFLILDKHGKNLSTDNVRQLAYSLGSSDPEKALKFLDSLPNSKMHQSSYGSVVSQWMKDDEEAALSYFNDLEDPILKSEIGQSFLSSLSYQDPEKFLRLYSSIDVRPDNSEWYYRNALSKLAQSDMEAAQKHLGTITNAADRKNAIKGMVEGLADNNPDAALAFVDKFSDESEKNGALGSIYSKIAQNDPEKVVQLMQENGFKKVGDYSVSSLMRTYARKDLEGAKGLLDSIQDPLIKDKVISSYIGAVADKDPIEALNYALTQPRTQGLKNAMYSLGNELAKVDPEGGLEIAANMERDSVSDALINRIYDEWAENDLEAAVEGLSLIQHDERTNSKIYSSIGNEFADDPDRAVEWINTIQNEKEASSATYGFVYSWSSNEPDAAAEWVNTLSDGSIRDSAVRSLVRNFDDAEPAYAMEWASSISDNKKRNDTLKSTYKAWQGRDSTAANNWLNQNAVLNQHQIKMLNEAK